MKRYAHIGVFVFSVWLQSSMLGRLYGFLEASCGDDARCNVGGSEWTILATGILFGSLAIAACIYHILNKPNE